MELSNIMTFCSMGATQWYVGLDLDSSRAVRKPLQPAGQVDLWLLKPKQRHSPLVVNLLADLLREIFAGVADTPASLMHSGLKNLIGSSASSSA
ncbi:hypothetical protein FHT76_008312 [Rhizobium sp. BK176]|nr:hypothetical protein [Rhizobium sp. BK181]MBB3544550.1 hypothetical protein [Rhizobium sp. BK399]MCS3744112.1 hypothetical protein [Rhizobium sp. BK661]MCS4096590.1 hypothetical protein [Rhizobium sp. BK176]